MLVVLGAAESGIGAARLACQLGEKVLVSDNGPITAERQKVLSRIGAEWEENGHSTSRILTARTIIKSPGIPDTVPIVIEAKAQGSEVISEVEYASRHTKSKLIGITGSNGKTTTATLIHHILQKGDVDVALVGNIGRSFAGAIADSMEANESQPAVYVIELSSFQLDGVATMRLDVAILLNITPDHLDRYDYDFSKYVAAKFKITERQLPTDAFIYCADDTAITDVMAKKTFNAHHYPITQKKTVEEGAWLEGDTLRFDLHGNTPTHNKHTYTMSIYKLALAGRHNLYNSMAAGITASIFDLSSESIRESLTDFQNIEHRLELVATTNGIEYINDSKATNVNATWYALESMKRPVVWIVGGQDKGNDYDQLSELVKEKVKAVICLGKDNAALKKAFGKMEIPFVETTSASDAVRASRSYALKGDTVLLSPACASFDLFTDYEDRGRQFKHAVRSL